MAAPTDDSGLAPLNGNGGRGERRRAITPAELIKQSVTVIAAAGSAYMAIRLDLQSNALQVTSLQRDVARHEVQLDRLRERAQLSCQR